DDQGALALALRCHQVEDTAGDVLGGPVAALELEALAREQRGQVLEQHLALAGFRRLAVDRVDHVQREVAFAVLGPADTARQMVAGAQVEAADLAGRDVGVVRAGQVAGLGAAQEAEAVGQDLQHAVGLHALVGAGKHLEQGEDHFLLARPGHAFVDVELLGDVEQLVRRHPLELAQRILGEAFGDVRRRHAVGLLVAAAAVVLRQAAIARAITAALLPVAAIAEAVALAGALGVVLVAAPVVLLRLALALTGIRCLGLAAALRWLAGLVGLGRLGRLVGLPGMAGLAGLAGLAWLAGLGRLAGLRALALRCLGWRRRAGRGWLGCSGPGLGGCRAGLEQRRRVGVGGFRRLLGGARSGLAHALDGGIAGVGGLVGQVGIPRSVRAP